MGLSRVASAAVTAHPCSPIRRRARGCRLRRSIDRLLQLIAIRRSNLTRTVVGISVQMAWINKRPTKASPRRLRHERRTLATSTRPTPERLTALLWSHLHQLCYGYGPGAKQVGESLRECGKT